VRPLLELPGVVIYNLHVGAAVSELDAFRTVHRSTFADFGDAGTLVQHPEAAVMCDIGVAHVCAGVGLPAL